MKSPAATPFPETSPTTKQYLPASTGKKSYRSPLTSLAGSSLAYSSTLGLCAGPGNACGKSPCCISRARSRSLCTWARSRAASCARMRTKAAETNPEKYSINSSSSRLKDGRPCGLRNSITPMHSSPSRSGAANKARVFHPVCSSALAKNRASRPTSSTRIIFFSVMAAPTIPAPRGTRRLPNWGALSPWAEWITSSPVPGSGRKTEQASARIHGRLFSKIISSRPRSAGSRPILPARRSRPAYPSPGAGAGAAGVMVPSYALHPWSGRIP